MKVAKVMALRAGRYRAHGRLDAERDGLGAEQDERADNGPEERLACRGERGRLPASPHEEEADVDEHEDDHDSADTDDKLKYLQHQRFKVGGTEGVQEAAAITR